MWICESLEQVLVDAKEIPFSLQIEAEFQNETKFRPKKKKGTFDYQYRDEATLSTSDKLKLLFFNRFMS